MFSRNFFHITVVTAFYCNPVAAQGFIVERVEHSKPKLSQANLQQPDPKFMLAQRDNFALKNGDKLYQVAEGDNLSKIADVFTGASHHWRAIARYNRLGYAADIHPGMVLLIPRWLLKRGTNHHSGSHTRDNKPSNFDKNVSDLTRVRRTDLTNKGEALLKVLHMQVGDFSLIESAQVDHVVVENKAVVQLDVIDSGDLLLAGLRAGTSIVRAWSNHGTHYQYKVVVRANADESTTLAINNLTGASKQIELFSPKRLSRAVRPLLIKALR